MQLQRGGSEMNDWRHENYIVGLSIIIVPTFPTLRFIILTFPTMGTLLLAGALTISIVGKNLQLIFANMGGMRTALFGHSNIITTTSNQPHPLHYWYKKEGHLGMWIRSEM